MIKIIPILIASTSCSGVSLAAESDSVLRQLGQDVYSSDNFSLGAIDDEALFAPTSDGDSDLGEQLILKRSPSRSVIRLNVETHLLYSNNISNVDEGTQNGFVFSGNMAASWVQTIGENLFSNISVQQSFYQYENNVDLDFTNTRTSAGLVKFLPSVDVALRADVVHDYARHNFLSDKIHGITSVRLAASKTFFHSPRRVSYVGLDLSSDMDSTDGRVERNSWTAKVGHTWKISDSFTVSGFADVARYDYDENGRSDTTVAIGVNMEYGITANVSLYSSVTYIDNDSNISGLDYTSSLGSLGVGLKATF